MNYELLAKHVQPNFVIDVGANNGYWSIEAKKVWPQAEFLLIEANEECRPYLHDSHFSYLIAVLSDTEKEVDFYTLRDCGTATGASYYREKTEFFEGDKVIVTKRRTTTLDLIFDRSVSIRNPSPMLLKLDTQGSELDILKGAQKLLPQIDAMLIEMSFVEYNEGAPPYEELRDYLYQKGFLMVGEIGQIVHPITREHIQSDILWKRLQAYGG